jgi:hypothetical protein
MKAFLKIHKNNITIRPIVNCINYPNYKAPKLIKILKQKINLKNKYTIKNSLELAKTLNIQIRKETKVESYDTTNLYTKKQ